MSCTFWIRRKRLAALKQKEAANQAVTVNEAKEKETTEKKPVKKAGAKKNDEGTN